MTDTLYIHVGLGGTFDHLHVGHHSFIRFAASLGVQLHIGICATALVTHKQYLDTIEPYAIRVAAVKEFCEKNQIAANIFELTDMYGPTVAADSQIEALAVTTDTVRGAVQINDRRQELGLPPLPVHVHELLMDQTGQPIRSTRIRAGEIDRHGTLFSQLFTRDVCLSDSQRGFFADPQGPLVTQPISRTDVPRVCVVGDVALDMFVRNRWPYDLGIFDGRTQRRATSEDLFHPNTTHRVTNPAGYISRELFTKLASWKHAPFKHLFVVGEEDLAAAALVLLLPLGSHIYYGQPDRGMVLLTVTESLKGQCYTHLH